MVNVQFSRANRSSKQVSNVCSFAFAVEGSCNGVECDAHAQCIQPIEDQPLQCECEEGWQGNGQTCSGNVRLVTFRQPFCFWRECNLSSNVFADVLESFVTFVVFVVFASCQDRN